MVGGVRYLEQAPPRTFAIEDVPLLREAGIGLERSPQLPIVRSGRDSPEPPMHTDGNVIIRKSERRSIAPVRNVERARDHGSTSPHVFRS
jgi:hypothetical protein